MCILHVISPAYINKGSLPHICETAYVKLTPYLTIVCLTVSGVDLKEPMFGTS